MLHQAVRNQKRERKVMKTEEKCRPNNNSQRFKRFSKLFSVGISFKEA